jgi:hypothetical protein
MNSSLPQLGLKLKKYSWFFLSLITSLSLLLVIRFFPVSIGDGYQKKLSKYYRLIDAKQFEKADQLETKLDKIDIDYVASLSHPRYIITTIKDILKKPNRNTDDLIEVSLLYFKIGDSQNGRHFLLLAQQSDPIRSDIDKLIQQLL